MLSTRTSKALEESHNAITKVWQDAKKAQDTAQTLFDEASNQFNSRKRSMETVAEKSAGAEAMCSKANNAVSAANGALAQATSESQTVSATVDKEIRHHHASQRQINRGVNNCVLLYAIRLTVLLSSPTSSLKPPTFRSRCDFGVVALQDSLRASTVAELLIGLDSSRHFEESDSINALLDQLLNKLRKNKSDAADKLAASTSAANAATADRDTKCGEAAALKSELVLRRTLGMRLKHEPHALNILPLVI